MTVHSPGSVKSSGCCSPFGFDLAAGLVGLMLAVGDGLALLDGCEFFPFLAGLGVVAGVRSPSCPMAALSAYFPRMPAKESSRWC